MKMSSVAPMQLHLHQILGENRPRFQWEMTPELAYGRHRGPAGIRSRQAAVAVVLLHDEAQGWAIPLTRRPTTLRHHGGQICFPGGRIEPGESAELAALREFEEELGVGLGAVSTCGRLPQQYVYASDNQVTPHVFVAKRPDVDWSPDPVEVDEVIEMPLSALTDEPVIEPISQNREIKTRQASGTRPLSPTRSASLHPPRGSVNGENGTRFQFHAPAYSFGNYRIWGATAVILNHLAQCLRTLSLRTDAVPSDAKMAGTSVRT